MYSDLRLNAERRIAQKARSIGALIRGRVPEDAKRAFVAEAQAAVLAYIAWQPPIDDPSLIDYRGEKAHLPRDAHRAPDPHRHALIADLFDAWTTARETGAKGKPLDVLKLRKFTPVANAVLRAAGLSFEVTDHDLAVVRDQWAKNKPAGEIVIAS